MALPGETVGGGRRSIKCPDCKEYMKIDVQRSNAGYYVGFWCLNCGPHSRESGYYREEREAQKALDTNNYRR